MEGVPSEFRVYDGFGSIPITGAVLLIVNWAVLTIVLEPSVALNVKPNDPTFLGLVEGVIVNTLAA